MSMDSKMMDLENLQRLTEKSKPAAHMLENVMADLEQRNSELASLYRSSEKNRADMEDMLKEQNDELKTLRANTLIMRTLENDVNEMTDKKHELEEKIKTLEHELASLRKQEQVLHQKVREVERQGEIAGKEHNTKIAELMSKISWSNDQLVEKDTIIERTEHTVKELFEKCQQMGSNAISVKNELSNCVESGNRLKDVNTKLQYCKEYLEEQLNVLIKELKSAKVENEQLKLEYANLSSEKQNCAKEIVLLNEELSESSNEITLLKSNLKSVQRHLKDFESGAMRSAVVMNEIKKERRTFEGEKESLEKKIKDLEARRDIALEELRNATLYERKQNTRMMEMEAKLSYFQENFIEKQELQKIKNDLEVRYKLDMNQQLKKVSSLFDKEQDELIRTMKASITLREDVETDLSARPSSQKLGDEYRFMQ